MRNVSPTLWSFEHLTALYLNDNNLLRLPSDIGQLVNLRTLDLSSNKLRSLPAELGELIHLRYVYEVRILCTYLISIISQFNNLSIHFNRELLLNNNLLRVLPNEIGKLFHIQILGLHGNPLQKDLQSIYNEPNGTQKLLTYLLDNLSCKFFSPFILCVYF